MTTDIDNIFEKWNRAKIQISELETKIEKYKKKMGKMMDTTDKNTIKGTNFSLCRKKIVSQIVLKKNIPQNIWDSYSTPKEYKAFYLRKNKTKSKKMITC